MNDLERNLRELLRTKANDAEVGPKPPRRVLRRARRRELGTVTTVLVVSTLVVLGSVAALQALRRPASTRPRPATQVVLPDGPSGFRSAALPYASIAFPANWYLLDTSPLESLGVARPYVVPSGPILQLANFDPDLPHSPRCMVDPDRLPRHGVLLTVGIMAPEEAAIANPPSGPWPVELAPLPSNQDPVCTGGPRPRIASWTAPSGLIYWANAAHGTDAAQQDIAAMERAFESLAFPPTDRPQMSVMAAFQGQGTPRVVLGTERIGPHLATIVAYLELNKTLHVGVSSSAGAGDCCLGGAIAPHTGSDEQPVTSTVAISPSGTLVYGVVAPEVARAELRTSSGEVLPVSTASLPPSLGVVDRVVWGIAPGADERATIVGYDAQGNALGHPVFPIGPRVTIATGDDPVGGPWMLYLEPTSEGVGLGFEFERSGGGGGCCLRPLEGEFRLDGWSSGGEGVPGAITAFASDDVERVVFEPIDGPAIEGELFPIEDGKLGIPFVALVIVPPGTTLEGDLIAFDAEGGEVGLEHVGDVAEPDGPSAEIDAVWDLLRRARDAASTYFERHGTFTTITVDALVEISGSSVTYSTRPEAEAVSVYVTDVGHAVLSSTAITGESYCIAIEADVSEGGFGYRYGAVFAESYEQCHGGWPELGT